MSENKQTSELITSQHFLDDTKLLFDSIRNLGICAAILFLGADLISSTDVMLMIVGVVTIVLATGLLFLNFNWTRNSLKSIKFTKWNSFAYIAFQLVLVISFFGMASKFL